MSLDRSNGQGGRGDQAFRDAEGRGTWQEMTYGGAMSFARRRYCLLYTSDAADE